MYLLSIEFGMTLGWFESRKQIFFRNLGWLKLAWIICSIAWRMQMHMAESDLKCAIFWSNEISVKRDGWRHKLRRTESKYIKVAKWPPSDKHLWLSTTFTKENTSGEVFFPCNSVGILTLEKVVVSSKSFFPSDLLKLSVGLLVQKHSDCLILEFACWTLRKAGRFRPQKETASRLTLGAEQVDRFIDENNINSEAALKIRALSNNLSNTMVGFAADESNL